jgi:hypothetical protein
MTPKAFHGKEGVAGSSPAEGSRESSRPKRQNQPHSSTATASKGPFGAKRGPETRTNLRRRRGRVALGDPFLAPEGAGPRASILEAPARGQSTRDACMTNPLTEPPPLEWPAPLMIVAEVAAVLRVTPKTIRVHIQRGTPCARCASTAAAHIACAPRTPRRGLSGRSPTMSAPSAQSIATPANRPLPRGRPAPRGGAPRGSAREPRSPACAGSRRAGAPALTAACS